MDCSTENMFCVYFFFCPLIKTNDKVLTGLRRERFHALSDVTFIQNVCMYVMYRLTLYIVDRGFVKTFSYIFCLITKLTLYKSLQIHQDENIILFFFFIAFAVIEIFLSLFSPPVFEEYLFCSYAEDRINMRLQYFKVISLKRNSVVSKTAVKTVHQWRLIWGDTSSLLWALFYKILLTRVSLQFKFLRIEWVEVIVFLTFKFLFWPNPQPQR